MFGKVRISRFCAAATAWCDSKGRSVRRWQLAESRHATIIACLDIVAMRESNVRKRIYKDELSKADW